MTQAISFIHAADLHLDTPFKGLTKLPTSLWEEVKESTFLAYDRLIETAIIHEVDFVLLVGDIFDEATQSLKAQMHLRSGFEKLQAENIAVYMSYGNHDFLEGNKFSIEYPDNVHVFTSENVSSFIYEKNNEACAEIHGFSYETRAVTDNKITEYDIQQAHIPYHIATLHGSLDGNQSHASYAPFQLQELIEKPFDYWALGHIHQKAILQTEPPIIYPGNIQGRHRNEAGSRGCYHVKMDGSSTITQFIPLQALRFENILVDITSCEKIEVIEMAIVEAMEEIEEKTLIHLTLTSENNESVTFEQEGLLEELIEIINEMNLEQTTWKYIYTHRFIFAAKQSTQGNFFSEDVLQALKEIDVKEAVRDLYHSPRNRRYLERLDDKAIKEKAAQLLTYGLHKKQ
ncbi:MAG TPA: DNA repair exonuclease [Pseudogracilibacillus sp.]|nr:DNA repair exonuclease [Pseudogracilibacillus sp.]